MLTVDVYDHAKFPVKHNFTLAATRYDAYARGGPHTANIDVTGLNLQPLRGWLGFFVIIRNENNTAVWWGMITDVSTPVGALQVSANFIEMFNRIKAIYATLDADNFSTGYTTAYAEHLKSIDTYGRKELLRTIGISNADQADAAALTMVTEAGLVQQDITLNSAKNATLRCSGVWSLLDWTYYANTAGRVTNDLLSSGEIILGWGTTATDIGFAARGIHKLGGDFGQMNDGDGIIISGSASNNGTKTAEGSVQKRETYTATTISFAPSDDILDTAEGLGIARLNSYIRVTGSSGNSRAHLVDGVGREHITTSTTHTSAIVTEAAGPSITIEQSSTMDLTTDVVIENPGATVTLASRSKIAMSFTLPVSATWTVGEVVLQVRREGTPVDTLRVSIYSDSSGSPGTQLDTTTITGLSKRLQSVTVEMNNTASVTYATTYWIVVERTGSASATNYYVMAFDDETGTIKTWNGSSWNSKTGLVPYQVWGHTKTSEQIGNILNDAQFIDDVSIRIDSGILARQYRDGQTTALAEIETLLDSGTSVGGTILATVNADWQAVVDLAPSNIFPPYQLGIDGKVRVLHGDVIENGVLPVGQWCEVDGIDQGAGALAPLSPFLVGFAEYTTSKGEITDIRAYGKLSIWDAPTLLQG